MDYPHFKRAVAFALQVNEDQAMTALDEAFSEDMLMFELFDTGSVTVKVGDREYILSVKVEEKL